MKHHRHFVVIPAVALAALLGAACGDDGTSSTTQQTADSATNDSMVDDSMVDGTGDILEVAAAEGDLGTFLAALDAAGIMDGLHGAGPFTVFIPTDEAFSAYLTEAGMDQAALFADPAALTELLNYHVVAMSEPSDMVMQMDGQSFTAVNGEVLHVAVDGDVVAVGGATILRYDILASNGVIHVIDAVLVPGM
ncbi:MAG: fasciclin domain-containing protein [Actinomycetia bacterium]|nr:fasciclin domain-containing protein [Actinomycetes bacterium]